MSILSEFIEKKSKIIDDLSIKYNNDVKKVQKTYEENLLLLDKNYQLELEKLEKEHISLIEKLTEIPKEAKTKKSK